eukprot:9787176-Alexandrium_andersonii.AAC.1
MYPHQLFSFVFKRHPDIFDELTNKRDVASFWAEVEARDDPYLVGNPLGAKAEWRTEAVPL